MRVPNRYRNAKMWRLSKQEGLFHPPDHYRNAKTWRIFLM